MLFLFQVDTGRMMTLDMSLALESIENLKTHVEIACKIPVDKQVLLISGGRHLVPDDRVCSFAAAGTDTNPIYLFSKTFIQADKPPAASVDYGSEPDLAAKVRDCIDLPIAYSSMQKRAQLARLFCEVGQAELGKCEKLVHEQHLQQQGWQVVVANLEDLSKALKVRWEKYEEAFSVYIKKRDAYLEFLKHFKTDLAVLKKIPVLPALIESQTQVPEQSEPSEDRQSESAKPEMSLYGWISDCESDDFLEYLYESCSKGLLQTDEREFLSLQEAVKTKLRATEDIGMKEIKGFSERLCGLEKVLKDAKGFVSEQVKLAESFQRNQSRANQTKEDSVLPDLCVAHQHQLGVMLDNHNKLREMKKKCMRCKIELSENLYHRLKWVVFMQDTLSELDNKLVFFFENLLNLQRQLDILEQVHTAPAIYLMAVAEVVRRRTVSQSFLPWASDLACHMFTIYNDEIARRKDFQAQIENHFLRFLFPGMDDLPPSFAIQAPSIYDSSLPKLVEEDVDRLKLELPELADCLQIPDMSAVINFFTLKDKDEADRSLDKTVEDKLIEVVAEAGLSSNLDQNILKAIENEPPQTTPHGLSHLKDLDRGCESETDTEEFEKVGQSPFDLHFDKGIPSPRPGTQDAATLTEVGERTTSLPPKKPPRTFQKPHLQTQDDAAAALQRTLSISGSQSNTESFTNLKNPSLESIDELSSLKNFSSNTESCFNSHHQQMQGCNSSTLVFRSKSISPHTPQSPKDIIQGESPNSPVMGHQQNDFVNDEFYIDESLPSSLSIETGQSQGEFVKQLDTANNVVALLQDDLQISRSEYEKMRDVVAKLAEIARQGCNLMRSEVDQVKSEVEEVKNKIQEGSFMEEIFGDLTANIGNVVAEIENRERETIQRLTVEHELEVIDFRKMAQSKNEEIQGLRDENATKKEELKRFVEENSELMRRIEGLNEGSLKEVEECRKKIDEMSAEREKCVKEVMERLKSEHKCELESIRARFKLMTMERSPSENSLEKIERGDYPSITNPEALLLQMTENFESEKEVAVSDAISKENEKWQKILDDRVKRMEYDFEQEKAFLLQDIQTRIQQDQEKQITQMREQYNNISLECIKYKNTIQQLTECGEETEIDLRNELEDLTKENIDLREEIEQLKKEQSTMVASVAVCEGVSTADAATSPVKIRKRSEISSSPRSGRIHIDSCKVGDLVVVTYDSDHANFRVMQDSNCLYFLNSDCLESLGLTVTNGQPNVSSCWGEVVEKEYCHARKPVNRFRVPQGTKFFRVKVKPTPMKQVPPTQCQQPTTASQPSHMSQSQTTSSQVSDVVATAAPSHSLPASPLKGNWEKAESQETTIPEEKGEEGAERTDEDVESGTELTEGFNVDNQSSIDR